MPGFSPKQLRDRWHNYISPKNSFGPWTIEEDRFIVQNVKKYGTKWSLIASHLKGRSDNCVKNRWNTVLKEDQIIHSEKYFNLIIPEKNYQPMPPIQPPQPKPKEELYLDVRFVEHFFKPASKAEMERWTKGSASTVKI